MDNKILMVAVSAIIAVTITAGALVPIIADVSNNEGGGGTPVTYGEQGDLELGLFDSTYSINLTYLSSGSEDGKYTCTLDSVNGESVDSETISFTPNQIIFASTTCTLYAHTTTDNNYTEFSVGSISTYDRYDSTTGVDSAYVYYDAGEDYLWMSLGGDGHYPKSGTTWYIRPVFSVDGPSTGLIQRGIYNYANGSAYIGESDPLPITFCAINTNKEIVTAQASVGSEVDVKIGEDDWKGATLDYSYNNENGIVSDLVVTATVSDPATVIEYPATYILGLEDHPSGGGSEDGSDVPSSLTTMLSVIPLLVIVGIVLMVVGVYRKQ